VGGLVGPGRRCPGPASCVGAPRVPSPSWGTVEALLDVVAGEIVILPGLRETSAGGHGDWPGRTAGLSPREAEVIALITQGLTNEEIAARAHLGLNTVKTYIRSAYRKIGVSRAPKRCSGGRRTASNRTRCAPSTHPSCSADLGLARRGQRLHLGRWPAGPSGHRPSAWSPQGACTSNSPIWRLASVPLSQALVTWART